MKKTLEDRKDLLEPLKRALQKKYMKREDLALSSDAMKQIEADSGVAVRTLFNYFGPKYTGNPQVGKLDQLAEAAGFASFTQFVELEGQKEQRLIPKIPNKALIEKWVSTRRPIKASLKFNQEHYGIDQPLLVPVCYAADSDYWKNWAFCEAVLHEPIKVQRNNEKFRFHLEVKEHHLAIYNNAGKKFLAAFYAADRDKKTDDQHMKELEGFLSGSSSDSEFILRTKPLRLSSGGVLPIVRYKPKGHVRRSEWVLLFWRDLHPQAWTIPLGGSHDLGEIENFRKRSCCSIETRNMEWSFKNASFMRIGRTTTLLAQSLLLFRESCGLNTMDWKFPWRT